MVAIWFVNSVGHRCHHVHCLLLNIVCLCLLGDYVCWLLISGLWLFGCFYASFLVFGGCWFDFRLF